MPSKKKNQNNLHILIYKMFFWTCKTGDNLQYQALQEIAFTSNEAFSSSSTPLPAAVVQAISIAWL